MKNRIKKELDILKGLIIKTIQIGKIFLFGSYADGKPDAQVLFFKYFL